MKFFHLYLFFLFTFLLYLTPSFCKKNWLSSKSSNKLAHRKSYKQQEFPKTLGNLRQLIFPEPLIEQKKSEIEESPLDYSLLSPLSIKQNAIIMPQKIYEKDKKEFGLTPANLSDIKSDQIYLVKNLTFLNSVPGFEDPNDAFKPIKHNPSVYHKDQAAYYNPVGNLMNIYKRRKDGLYSVPIEIFANGTRIYEENKQKNEIKNRLKRDKTAYYDPFYMPFVEILDPLNKTLIKAARNRLSPPTQEYDEYLKEKQREKYNIDLLLGKKEKIPRTFGKDEALEQALKKEKTKREAKEVADQVKTDFHLAKSQKRKNHDSILISEKRFKQINRKNLEKKRQQTKIK